MAYVDFNTVRADMVKTPESSDFTSIQERMQAVMRGKEARLLSFVDKTESKDTAVPFNQNNYFELVDWLGRTILANKR